LVKCGILAGRNSPDSVSRLVPSQLSKIVGTSR
jgi:hypothetical protein